MNRYIQITIETLNADESDIFVARLSQSGFEGFEEEPGKLHAFIPETLYDASKIEKIIADINFKLPKNDLFLILFPSLCPSLCSLCLCGLNFL